MKDCPARHQCVAMRAPRAVLGPGRTGVRSNRMMPDPALRVPCPHVAEDRLSDLLMRQTARVTSERVTLGDMGVFLGDRSISGLLLVLALPMALPVPAPGISVLFGVPMIVISAQLALGCRRVWLPARLARRSVPRSTFLTIVDRILPKLRRFERIVRPRAGWLAGHWTRVPVGIICLVLAIIITLPVPLGHVVPGTAISVLALGLIERDGIAIALGIITAVAGLLVVILASAGILTAARLWRG